MKSILSKKMGFTIIEVVLVLAVAGLIFLVVFAAIPRLQASRRDNQRKRDAEAIYALAIEFEGAHGDIIRWADAQLAFNTTPGAGDFWPYIENENFEDPSIGDYTVTSSSGIGNIYISGTRQCSTDGNSLISAPTNQFGILMRLERGNYCLDNSP